MTYWMRALLLLLPAALLLAQPNPEHYSADAQLVLVDVQVMDDASPGQVAELLSRKDFEIYDNGVRREVEDFSFETAPLDLVFVIYGPIAGRANRGAPAPYAGLREAGQTLLPGDRVAVLRSADQRMVDLELSENMDTVRGALSGSVWKQRPEKDRLYDTVRLATQMLPSKRDPSIRRAIVVLSDDIDVSSQTKLPDLISTLLEADVTLNEVVYPSMHGPGRSVGAGGVSGIPTISRRFGPVRTGTSLRDAVDATGGELVPGDQSDTLPSLIRGLRMRYLLGIYVEPTSEREFHRLEVRLTADAKQRYPKASVRAREGYYSAPATVRPGGWRSVTESDRPQPASSDTERSTEKQ